MPGVYLRLGASLLGLVAGAAAVVVAVLLLRSVPGPESTTSSPVSSPTQPAAPATIVGGRIPTPNSPAYPSPPPNAVVLSREAGTNALGVAFAPANGKTLVRASVLNAAGDGAKGLDVRLSFDGGPAHRTAACGPGCYQTVLAGVGSARRLSVSLGKQAYAFVLPAHTSDGRKIVSQATATWNGLTSVIWHERLAGSPTEVLNTVYEAVAPSSLAYTIDTGSAAIIIGGSRWDRGSNADPWVKSSQEPPLVQPSPYWRTPVDAHVIGSTAVAGRPVWIVSFFDPASPAWFTAEIDKQNHRTLVLDMTAADHFMHHVYGPFDTAVKILPPT